MSLPPGVNSADFTAALKAFEAAVGRDWVFTSDDDVALYRDAYSQMWGEPDERQASAAVAPSTVEEVQAVMRAANRYRVPIYPISTGRNLGYGGSAPALSGSVVLDLKRLNRIIEVSERHACALVEPGVSYFDLYRHISERGLKVWLDCPDPGWGSLMGNALDRGGGVTSTNYRNHFEAHCGMEVVLANGDLLRTGMGALPNSNTWQQFKTGFGPAIDGIFSQSNFGVVTKMGFWLMPEPEAYLNGFVHVYKHEDLIALIDIVTLLENSQITNGMPYFGSPIWSGLRAPDMVAAKPEKDLLDLLATPGGPSKEALEGYAQKVGKGLWGAMLQFYGPPKIIQAQWEYCKEKLGAIPGAKLIEGESYKIPLTPEQLLKVSKNAFGVPSLSIFSLIARNEEHPGLEGHVGFSPIIPRTGEAVFEAQKVFGEIAKEYGLPVSPLAVPFTYWQRCLVYLFLFPVLHDKDFNRRNREAFRKLVKVSAEHGWGEYRTPVLYQDDVMDVYSFNNHALRRFHETVKDAVDPNGILSAGRYGIWPKHLRKS
ncbi:MAG TPA: FAD-binding oxidoreductase [Steroidobacteraceae bacterium]|nr:FAD-binding oxidoreductase [Steroidobacteraceae bacterium]